MEKILSALSDQYERQAGEMDSASMLQLAEQYFRQVQLRQALELEESDLDAGDVDKAFARRSAFMPFSLDGQVRSAAEIQPEPVRWLWPGWLARGEMALFDGNPGVGKSQLLLDIAARVTRGWKMPPEPRGAERGKPHTIILMTAEDTWKNTVVPRLMLAEADLERVKPLTELLTFPRDLSRVERAVSDHAVKLLVIEPIMAFIGSAKWQRRNASPRRTSPAPRSSRTDWGGGSHDPPLQEGERPGDPPGRGQCSVDGRVSPTARGRDGPRRRKQADLGELEKQPRAGKPPSLAFRIAGDIVPTERWRIETSPRSSGLAKLI